MTGISEENAHKEARKLMKQAVKLAGEYEDTRREFLTVVGRVQNINAMDIGKFSPEDIELGKKLKNAKDDYERSRQIAYATAKLPADSHSVVYEATDRIAMAHEKLMECLGKLYISDYAHKIVEMHLLSQLLDRGDFVALARVYRTYIGGRETLPVKQFNALIHHSEGTADGLNEYVRRIAERTEILTVVYGASALQGLISSGPVSMERGIFPAKGVLDMPEVGDNSMESYTAEILKTTALIWAADCRSAPSLILRPAICVKFGGSGVTAVKALVSATAMALFPFDLPEFFLGSRSIQKILPEEQLATIASSRLKKGFEMRAWAFPMDGQDTVPDIYFPDVCRVYGIFDEELEKPADMDWQTAATAAEGSVYAVAGMLSRELPSCLPLKQLMEDDRAKTCIQDTLIQSYLNMALPLAVLAHMFIARRIKEDEGKAAVQTASETVKAKNLELDEKDREIEKLRKQLAGEQKKTEELSKKIKQLESRQPAEPETTAQIPETGIFEENAELRAKVEEMQDIIAAKEAKIEELRAGLPETEELKFRQYYPGETREMVLDILDKWLKDTHGPSRRRDVIKALLEQEKPSGALAARKEAVKKVCSHFEGSRTSGFQNRIKELGMWIEKGGAHDKLHYEDYSGVYITVSLTPSETQRTGKNLASEIIRSFL